MSGESLRASYFFFVLSSFWLISGETLRASYFFSSQHFFQKLGTHEPNMSKNEQLLISWGDGLHRPLYFCMEI